MKKLCLALLCAAFLAAAPAALAADDSADSLGGLLEDLVALFFGLTGDPEIPGQFPPGGQPAVEQAGHAGHFPSNNSVDTAEELEMGVLCPPGG